MKITSITNFNITPNKYNNQPSHSRIENMYKNTPSFKGAAGGAIGTFAGEMATLALKSLLGLTGIAEIVILGAICMTGYAILGDCLENKILSLPNNDSEE